MRDIDPRAERTEFLNDVLITFAEGGIQMVGVVVDHEFVRENPEDIGYYRSVTIDYMDEGDSEHHVVTVETVAKGLRLIREGEVKGLSEDNRTRLKRLDRELDAGEIDAVDATNIVETGLFGEVVYG